MNENWTHYERHVLVMNGHVRVMSVWSSYVHVMYGLTLFFDYLKLESAPGEATGRKRLRLKYLHSQKHLENFRVSLFDTLRLCRAWLSTMAFTSAFRSGGSPGGSCQVEDDICCSGKQVQSTASIRASKDDLNGSGCVQEQGLSRYLWRRCARNKLVLLDWISTPSQKTYPNFLNFFKIVS